MARAHDWKFLGLALLLLAGPAVAQVEAPTTTTEDGLALPAQDAAGAAVPPAEPPLAAQDGTAIPSDADPGRAVTPPVVPTRPSGQPELLPGVLDSQIQKCWSVPMMKGDIAEGGIARIRVKLEPDGRLAAPPAIIDKPAGRLGLVFAESAARAITKCQPYTLPPEQYESWKDVMLIFDTLNF